MTQERTRPLPGIDELTQPFWAAAREGRLVVQRCQACSYYNHPPRRECDRCLSGSLVFEPVSGAGTVWSYTVMYQPSIPGFQDKMPYVDALVELDEQPMLLLFTNLPGVVPDQVKIGQRVEVVFERLTDDVHLPQFVPVTAESRP